MKFKNNIFIKCTCKECGHQFYAILPILCFNCMGRKIKIELDNKKCKN